MQIKQGDYIEKQTILAPVTPNEDPKTEYQFFRILKIDSQKLYLYENLPRLYGVTDDWKEVHLPYLHHDFSLLVSDGYELISLNDSVAEKYNDDLITMHLFSTTRDLTNVPPKIEAVRREIIYGLDSSGHMADCGTRYTWDDGTVCFPLQPFYYNGRRYITIKGDYTI